MAHGIHSHRLELLIVAARSEGASIVDDAVEGHACERRLQDLATRIARHVHALNHDDAAGHLAQRVLAGERRLACPARRIHCVASRSQLPDHLKAYARRAAGDEIRLRFRRLRPGVDAHRRECGHRCTTQSASNGEHAAVVASPSRTC
eukprot:2693276-Prymnesium_polylepis.1